MFVLPLNLFGGIFKTLSALTESDLPWIAEGGPSGGTRTRSPGDPVAPHPRHWDRATAQTCRLQFPADPVHHELCPGCCLTHAVKCESQRLMSGGRRGQGLFSWTDPVVKDQPASTFFPEQHGGGGG